MKETELTIDHSVTINITCTRATKRWWLRFMKTLPPDMTYDEGLLYLLNLNKEAQVAK